MQGVGLASLPGFARRAWDVTGELWTRIGWILHGRVLPTVATFHRGVRSTSLVSCIWQDIVTMTPVTHVQGWRTLAAHRPTVWRGCSSTAEDKHDGRLTRGGSRVSHVCRARVDDH
jgi:hypothetical protein